jgi:hypothetical protein
MKRKSPIIQQGKVTALMIKLANLPEREKAPDDPVSLPEIFRTKEYAAEVKAALKKGYTFENLAEIFTGMCGVAVSARQIKYHFTRGKNLGVKNNSAKTAPKTGASGAAESHVSSADSLSKSDVEGMEENVAAPESEANSSSIGSGFVFEDRAATDEAGNANTGAFFFGK